MKLNCERFQEEWPGYERGELALELREAMGEHLAGCATCQRNAAADRAIARALDGLPMDDVSAGFPARVRARLQAEIGAERARRVAAPLLAAAAVLLGVGGWLLLKGWSAPQDRDRDVIAALDTLEQIELLGPDILVDGHWALLEPEPRDARLPVQSMSDEEGGL